MLRPEDDDGPLKRREIGRTFQRERTGSVQSSMGDSSHPQKNKPTPSKTHQN